MEIRRIRPDDDLDLAGRIVVDAYMALDGYPGDEEYEAMMRDVGARMNEVDVVVALVDDRIVGCLTFVGDPSSRTQSTGTPMRPASATSAWIAPCRVRASARRWCNGASTRPAGSAGSGCGSTRSR